MSKSAIYVVNSTTQSVADGGTIDLGVVQRRFGCNFALDNNAIRVAGAGYYDFSASFTVAPTAAGDVTITMYKDNTAIPGAITTQTAAAANDSVNLTITALVREGCSCCDSFSNITFVLSGEPASITNVAIVGEKI